MSTTLTREALKEKAACRYEEVDVPGWGRIGIRSCPEHQRSLRQMQYIDDRESYRISKLIDQLMSDQDTPLLTEEDREWLKAADSYRLDPLHAVLDKFNGDDEGKGQGGSND